MMLAHLYPFGFPESRYAQPRGSRCRGARSVSNQWCWCFLFTTFPTTVLLAGGVPLLFFPEKAKGKPRRWVRYVGACSSQGRFGHSIRADVQLEMLRKTKGTNYSVDQNFHGTLTGMECSSPRLIHLFGIGGCSLRTSTTPPLFSNGFIAATGRGNLPRPYSLRAPVYPGPRGASGSALEAQASGFRLIASYYPTPTSTYPGQGNREIRLVY
jgi:hypothetical protein